MATIRPFCALRYSPERVSHLSQVIAPPYDVIDAKQQEQLYQASPHNIVRLILGKQSSADTPEDNRYTRAQREFAAWREVQILRRDPALALYVVEHRFTDAAGHGRARLGFIALLEFNESIEQTAYRHEATLSAPKEDRTKLLQAIPANLEPIFCIYPDEGATVQSLLRTLIGRQPPAVAARIGVEDVTMWLVTDPQAIEAVTRGLAPSTVLIADGHHRFEVAFANRQRHNAVMSYFVSMAEPSLVVRPIHRILRGQGRADAQALRELCTLEPVEDLAALTRWLENSAQQGSFGYCDGQQLFRAQLKADQLARWLMAPSVALPLAALDVSLLHGLILPRLGLPGAVEYTAEAASALQAVQQSRGVSAWLLRALPLQQVYAIAASGLALPPKSTYFYPKVPSGLTIHLLA